MDEKKMNQEVEVNREVDLDDLDQVSGGVGLRTAKKRETTAITEDTKNKA